ATNRMHDLVESLGLLQQHGAAAMSIHRLARTAEIKIDAIGAKFHGTLCIGCHGVEVIAEQLHTQGSTALGTTTVEQFGATRKEHPIGVEMVEHSHEFRDYPIEAALSGDQAP